MALIEIYGSSDTGKTSAVMDLLQLQPSSVLTIIANCNLFCNMEEMLLTLQFETRTALAKLTAKNKRRALTNIEKSSGASTVREFALYLRSIIGDDELASPVKKILFFLDSYDHLIDHAVHLNELSKLSKVLTLQYFRLNMYYTFFSHMYITNFIILDIWIKCSGYCYQTIFP